MAKTRVFVELIGWVDEKGKRRTQISHKEAKDVTVVNRSIGLMVSEGHEVVEITAYHPREGLNA